MDASCSNVGPSKTFKHFTIRTSQQLMHARDEMLLEPQHTVMCLYFPEDVIYYDVLTFKFYARRYGKVNEFEVMFFPKDPRVIDFQEGGDSS
ncbi:hypothetical protein TSUD_347200 [Trifolium subterraneum]|nr:hypothetical protein TSUD_347200 [Trifolium subterraneum]